MSLTYEVRINTWGRLGQDLASATTTITVDSDEDSREARNAVYQEAQNEARRQGMTKDMLGAGFGIVDVREDG